MLSKVLSDKLWDKVNELQPLIGKAKPADIIIRVKTLGIELSLPRILETQLRQNPLLNQDVLKALLINFIHTIGAYKDILVEDELRDEDVRFDTFKQNFTIILCELVSWEI